jgi:UPF0755 protein
MAMTAPVQPPAPVTLEFPRGTSSTEMARKLAESGVIGHPLLFQAARLARRGVNLQAGEYRFSEAASVWQVLDRIARGDVVRLSVVIPEGSNRWEIAELLERAKVISASEFLEASASPALIADLAPRAPSLEGFLFPATYEFPRGTTATSICRTMTQRFRQTWKELPKGPGASALRMATMASLIETETGVADERPLVSAVFWNRLSKKMKLGCDPTVVYAALLEGKWRGKIYRSDLDREHPYNTYAVFGLPPGPIANAGAASLKAALNPADVQYLFFVAKADGSRGHAFSADSKSHERAVRTYRERLAAQKP